MAEARDGVRAETVTDHFYRDHCFIGIVDMGGHCAMRQQI